MDSEKSRLERLKRSLYSRDENAVPVERRTPVSETSFDVKNSWGEAPSFELTPEAMTRKKNSFFNKFLLFSIIFLLLASGISAFIFFGGWNSISSNNVDIKIAGPSSVSSGEELDANLSVVNSNRTSLQNVTLSIDYPDGTQNVDKSGTALTRDKIDLGTIANGASKDYSLRALLFGEKDAIKTITMTLQYSVTGSNAVFSKTKTYDVSIDSSPLILNVDYPKAVNSGQDVVFNIDVTSNSSVVVQNSLVKIEYPYGFTYKSSSVQTLSGGSTSNVWSLGDLKNGDKKTFTVTGTLVGQNMENRTFRVSVGTGNDASAKDFTTDLAVQQPTVGISKSFYNLGVGTQNDKNVSQIGQNVSVAINWQNTLPSKVVNNIVVAKLSGNVFDRTNVSANNGGFYRSLDNSITWDKNTTSGLDSIDPGENGTVSLTFISLSNPSQINGIKNPHVDISVEIDGTQTGSDSSNISSTANTTIKFDSSLNLSANSYRNIGPFSNTGPIPPKADTESTYTITWSLSNTTNDLSSTTVYATLPVGVVWKSNTAPSSEHITFSPDTRIITWNAGSISAGVGLSYSPRTVSFQVGLTPSVTQVGSVLQILSATSASSFDTYTGSRLTSTAGPLNTRYSDPGFVNGNDAVSR